MGHLPKPPWISAPPVQTVFLCVPFNYFLHESFKAKKFIEEEKKKGIRTDEKSDMQNRETPIKYSLKYCSLIFNRLWQRFTLPYDIANSRCVYCKCNISEAACCLLRPHATAGQWVQYCTSGTLVHFIKFGF